MFEHQSALNTLVEKVRESSKYAHIAPDFIRRLGAEELAKRDSLKEAIKATKNTLHQIGGAYWQGKAPYARWIDCLHEAIESERESKIKHECRNLLGEHASSRERLLILEDFYATLLADSPPIQSVIDVACGLNPLTAPWMPLAPQARYAAYDIYGDMMGFLGEALALFGYQAEVQTVDVLENPPQQPADVAFVFKALPCLQQINRDSGRFLLECLHAKQIFVSYPLQSLGGRAYGRGDKGMAVHYETQFRALVADTDWHITRYEFATELVFRIVKPFEKTFNQ